ncbi:ABC transporter substrate-binding protein [Embleya sp. NPDC050493]|uniref:ABC transporter substrate-binding protein n=1 Tax=Embleya sp. NPDC050493 TaxID=3363989 RepID=UPI0037AB2291
MTGVLALVAASAACGGGGASAAHTLTMLAVQDSTTLDPFRANTTALVDGPRLNALYDPLFYLDTTTGKATPHLGESLSSADGGATWTMKLRPDVRFSDGTPFDAAAVKLNYDTHAKPETRSLQRNAAASLRTAVVDPLTLSITVVGAPNPNLDRIIATNLPYIEAPSAIAQGPDTYGSKPIGAGPFTLDTWTRGSEQTFVKNKDYWQKHKGLPKLDRLVIRTVPDIEQQYSTVKSGQADLFPSSDPRLLARAGKELKAVEAPVGGGQMVQFSLARAPFDDPRARRAIALSLDAGTICRVLDNGCTPATGLFSPAGPFFDAGVTQPAPDRAEAQRLFDALAAEGKKVDFTFLIPRNPSAAKAAETIQSRLREFRNVAMTIDAPDVGTYLTKYAVQKDFQAMLFQLTFVDPEPILFNFYTSTSAQNATGWKNPEADRALAGGRQATDPAVRRQAYADLQRALVADLPIWVYTRNPLGLIHTTRVTDLRYYGEALPFLDRVDVG